MPTLRALRPDNMGVFKCPTQVKDLTVAIIGQFIQDFKAGRVAPPLKSGSPPKVQGDVFTLVGDTWDSIILDPTKDVFVKYFAPWCGHCKELAPVWDKVGEHFKNNKDIVIARFDATAN